MALRLSPWFVVLAAVTLTTTDVESAPPHPLPPSLVKAQVPASVGAPNSGRLVNGLRLSRSRSVRIVPAWSNLDSRWGHPALVHMVERAARTVNKRYPRAKLSVGDISRRSGGPLREHLSHQSGRDVDIGFYLKDRKGKPVYPRSFVRFDGNGRSSSLKSVRFDDARNWTLIEALLSDPKAKVTRIFISSPLRARLLRHAEKHRVPLRVRLRAARVMKQPKQSTPHADHFHVRIGCPRDPLGVCETHPRARRLLVKTIRRASDTTSRLRRGTSKVIHARHHAHASRSSRGKP